MDEITKTEFAYRTLRQEILETRLKPGVPLKLGAMREAYGIGWTPLREALSRLEAEHLVTSSANKGYTVAPVSLEELSDLTAARRLVELPMLAESIANGDEAWETELVAAHFRLSRCAPPTERPEDLVITDWEERHDAFHMALLSACKSPWLMRFYVQIRDQLRRHHRVLAIAPGLSATRGEKWRGSAGFHALCGALALAPHTELMNAALNHDIDGAVGLLGAHIELTRQVFVAADLNGAGARDG
jgi:DNA-binding GntR family transcriptional regulator